MKFHSFRMVLIALLVLAASCGGGGGGSDPVVLSAPPPPPPSEPPPPGEPPPDPDPDPSPTAPLIGGLTLFGGSGGQAPHAIHVRGNVDAARWVLASIYRTGDRVETSDGSAIYECTADHAAQPSNEPGVGASFATVWRAYSTTRSGFWPEGRWQFQFVKADGTALDTADRDWMRVTDPVSGSLVTTHDRYGASPNAAFVFRSPGSYKARVRYQNRDKEWSGWVESATITVAANSRTKRYVNGTTGSDAYDGLAASVGGGHGPKKTLNSALSLVNGDQFEIEVADDTSCDVTAWVNTGARRGLWVHRSGGGQAKPTVVMKTDQAVVLGNDAILEGLQFAFDGVTTRQSVGLGASKTNLTVADCDFAKCQSILESGSDRFPGGVLLLRLVQQQRVDRYALYMDQLDSIDVLGCDLTGGSTGEHTVRLNGKYVAVECSTLDYASSPLNKSAFRCYARHVGVHRSVLARGTVHLGNIDNDATEYRDYCVDGCKIVFDGTSLQAIILWNNVGRVVMRTSFIKKNVSAAATVISFDNNADGGVRSISGVRLYNLSVQNTGTPNNSGSISALGLTLPATDVLIRGCVWDHDPADWTWGIRFHLGNGDGTGWMMEDCVHSLVPGNEVAAGGANFDVAAANLETWAEGLVSEDHTFDGDAKPLGAGTMWKAAVHSAVGVFRSLNGVEWAGAGPAGCWVEAP